MIRPTILRLSGDAGDRLSWTVGLGSFIATSVPPFILALLLLAVFYVVLKWFPPGRFGIPTRLLVTSTSSSFKSYTGLVTVDGLLNGRFDVTVGNRK